LIAAEPRILSNERGNNYNTMSTSPSSALSQLKASGTIVVADSGDLKKLAATGAHDATTNVRVPFGSSTTLD
jgi:hypothetical protein